MNAFTLKIFAMIIMVMDHVHTYIPGMPAWFTYLGRIVAPIFFFFIVEGFFKTSSRRKYAIRLFGWAAFMYFGSRVVETLFVRESIIYNNIFLSLAMSVVLMSVLEWRKENKNSFNIKLISVALIIIVSTASVFTEGSIYGLGMTLVFYFNRDNKYKLSAMYIIVSLVLTLGFAFPEFIVNPELDVYGLFFFDVQWMQVFALPFILFYNGERGVNTRFSKYLFYIFYPAHIWAIYILGGWV